MQLLAYALGDVRREMDWRDHYIVRLHAAGYSLGRIATELGLSKSAVAKIVGADL